MRSTVLDQVVSILERIRVRATNLLEAGNRVRWVIDHQSLQLLTARSHQASTVIGNVTVVAEVARIFGVPPWQVDGLIEDYAYHGRGEAKEVYDTVQAIAGTEPREVVRFARDHAVVFNSPSDSVS